MVDTKQSKLKENYKDEYKCNQFYKKISSEIQNFINEEEKEYDFSEGDEDNESRIEMNNTEAKEAGDLETNGEIVNSLENEDEEWELSDSDEETDESDCSEEESD